MKIKALATILFTTPQSNTNGYGLEIELHDDISGTNFAKIFLDSKATCEALSRLARTECTKAEVKDLDKVGKKQEIDHIKFKFSNKPYYGEERRRLAYEEALKNCPEGWEVDNNFGSQNSFFSKDNEDWARATIRRWVENND